MNAFTHQGTRRLLSPGIPNNAPDAISVDLGKLGADGLKSLLAFPPIALDRGPGTTYYVTREVPYDCISLRLHATLLEHVSFRLSLRRAPELGPAFVGDDVVLPLKLVKGQTLALAVHDSAPLRGYWSNLAGPYRRVFGAALVTDRLAHFLPTEAETFAASVAAAREARE